MALFSNSFLVLGSSALLKYLKSSSNSTIMQLSDDNFYSRYSYEELKTEYKLGVDARPAHIRENLDIVREKWMRMINDKLNNNNIVVLKGASGQGKSSLAYRYLIDNLYTLNQIITIIFFYLFNDIRYILLSTLFPFIHLF